LYIKRAQSCCHFKFAREHYLFVKRLSFHKQSLVVKNSGRLLALFFLLNIQIYVMPGGLNRTRESVYKCQPIHLILARRWTTFIARLSMIKAPSLLSLTLPSFSPHFEELQFAT